MNLTKVEARNIQGLQYALVEPKAAGATVIGGKNRAGKTSLLTAIATTLGGKDLCPANPIREGQDSAECHVTLSEDTARMFPACTVTRKWKRKENGEETSTLSIKTADGFAAPSPQSILDKILGTLGFEPETFLHASEKDQVAILRELVGLDFTALDEEYKSLYAERTAVNKQIKAAEAQYQAKPFHNDAIEKEVSVTELMEELARREAIIEDNDKLRVTAEAATLRKQNSAEFVAACEVAVREATERLEKARAELAANTIDEDAALDRVASLMDPDLSTIRQQISQADTLNRKFRDNSERKRLKDYHDELVSEADAQTKRLTQILETKEQHTADAQWPIEGLGFNENGVTFHGRPFSQASTMEQMKTAIAIRAALSPALQFAFLRDGSLLDDEQLADIALFAQEKNLQLFIERVGSGTECDIVISDGRIVGQQEPVLETKPVKPKKAKAGELALEV